MANPLPFVIKNQLQNTSTMKLRGLLRSRVHKRDYKCYAYAVLLQRRHRYQLR